VQGPARRVLFGALADGVGIAIRGIGRIGEAKYQQYKRNRDGKAPHDDAWTWDDAEEGERARRRYELERILRMLDRR
jgi:hypothetical protein